ncbi:DoxX family membrane protein [Flavobacterium sp. CBA20B-1]|uniref:DoxX family membrane protein n=1 Tax=unclassified Flavobacterium TaxID=196869 RepID=UPI0022247C3D|nr:MULTISPECIES: DoxX family membrane protein [unclassified Flavobacterium]WCM43132.1 DoxX family membrane protein [Flavobacterium sp. CBA20B-1]
MKIFKNIVFALFGLMFANAGLDKFVHYMPIPEMDSAMQEIAKAMVALKWLLPLVGAVELLGGVLVLIPKTRLLGALMIFPVLIGILCHNATFAPEGLAIAGILFFINIWIFIDQGNKLKPLLG